MVTRLEVGQHATRESCWVIIKDQVYDLTTFVDSHPGGSKVILKYAGNDATDAFEPIHPSDTLEKFLKPHQCLGSVAGPPLPAKEVVVQPKKPDQNDIVLKEKNMRLSSIINIQDFEKAASQILSKRSFAFFKTGAEDEYTLQRNLTSWRMIRFRPRILRPIPHINLSTKILGTKSSAPFFICPAGGGKLAHPTGEILMTKAAAKHDILHWICNNAGCSQEEMSDARAPGQVTFWQIYAMSDLSVTEKEVRRAVELGFKGFALTVDAISAGKRERDMRAGIEEEDENKDYSEQEEEEEEDESFASGPTVKRPPVWSNFDWDSAVQWLRSIIGPDLPIAIKGIQSWEDAALCMNYGVHPWLSNHAGRQLDGAASSVETLIEIRKYCPEVFEKCEVIVDGGVTRGTDIVKALALGAKAVGLGRPFLYSLVFGEVGVGKAIRILKHEIEIAMALLGVTSIEQLNPSYVDTSAMAYVAAFPPRSHL